MKYISHRGNLAGLFSEEENSLKYIDNAISVCGNVEIDLRSYDSKLYLGHDEPQYPVTSDWLFERRHNLWIHAKDWESLQFLNKTNLQYFWHTSDDFTLTSTGHIWSHNFDLPMNNMCIVPLLSLEEVKDYKQTGFFAVCSDFIFEAQQKFGDT